MTSKKQAKLIMTARIQRAVTGYKKIPMLEIVGLYRAMENAVANGANDNDLKAIVAGWARVEVAA